MDLKKELVWGFYHQLVFAINGPVAAAARCTNSVITKVSVFNFFFRAYVCILINGF